MNASEFAKQRMPHADKFKPFTQSLDWGQYISPQTDSIFSAAGQAKLQGQRTLQRQHTQLQGQPSHRGLAPERLQTQSQNCMLTVWVRPSQIQRRVEPLAKSDITVGGLDISQMYAEEIQIITTRLRSIT